MEERKKEGSPTKPLVGNGLKMAKSEPNIVELLSVRFDEDGKQLFRLRQSSGVEVERHYGDFLRLSHARRGRSTNDLKDHTSACETSGSLKRRKTDSNNSISDTSVPIRLPKKALRMLGNEAPWSKGGEGWQRMMTASVRRVEKWLNCFGGGHTDEVNADLARRATETFLSPVSGNPSVRDTLPSKEDEEEGERRARKLQQYFCTDANCHALIQAATADLTQKYDDLLFVEPSCGDGRIMIQLAEFLTLEHSQKARELSVASVSIVGVEIDPKMAQVARASIDASFNRVDEATAKQETNAQQIGKDRSHDMQVMCSDFLNTNVEDLLFWDTQKESLKVGCASPPRAVVVLGGPPYSDYEANAQKDICATADAIPDNSASSSSYRLSSTSVAYESSVFRSFPLRFVLRSALPPPRGLGAQRVAFLLPKRCARDEFKQQVLSALHNTKERAHWKVSVHDLCETHFEFQGREVPVPSVIWILDLI